MCNCGRGKARQLPKINTETPSNQVQAGNNRLLNQVQVQEQRNAELQKQLNFRRSIAPKMYH